MKLKVRHFFCCVFLAFVIAVNKSVSLSHVQRYSLWNNEPTLLDLRKSNDVVRPIEESCSMSNCFNFSKCFAQNSLKVYVYRDQFHLKQSSLYSKLLSVIRSSHYYTEDSSDACLFVLSVDTIDRDRISENYQNIQESHIKTDLWNDGRNHLVFNLYFGTYPDYANTDLGFGLGKAMVAWASSSLQNFRPNFDISFPLFNNEHPSNDDKSWHFQSGFPDHDQYLASFKGKRYVYGIGSKTRNLLHHLNDDRSIVIATTCKHNTDWKKFEDERCEIDNANYGRWNYEQLMMNSTFCLIPRGRRLGSFRFLEALRSVCIPVILSDEWVLPFSEVIDWSEAVVLGKERSALFIYDYLALISEERILQMRQTIQMLYRKYFSSIERIILTSIEIVLERVKRNLGEASKDDWMCFSNCIYLLTAGIMEGKERKCSEELPMSNEKNTKEEEAIVSDEESQSTGEGSKDTKKATDEMMLVRTGLNLKRGTLFKKKRRVDPKTIDLTIKKEHEGPRKTKAELAFIKRQGETAFDRLSKRAQISHREKVEKFNKQMEELTEFNDIPKVSWTK
ncbi:hypothetical protein GPALN_011240 [Globodera pallida]|nr:hypothetical protein GPALN_011240 [Globodera pallida]